MIDLKKFLLRRRAKAAQSAVDADSQYLPSGHSSHGLEVEYHGIIVTQFRRWKILPSSITIEVKRLGGSSEGFDVFIGMVRLTRWDRLSILRVLIGWPILEAKVRKSVAATWLADVSHFEGLWLHASEEMEVPRDLREILAAHVPFEGHRSQQSGPAAAGSTPSNPGESSQPGSSTLTGPGNPTISQPETISRPA